MTDSIARADGATCAWPAEFSRPYSRVLLKLSGEALMGSMPYGIDPLVVGSIARCGCQAPERARRLAPIVSPARISVARCDGRP